MADNVASEALTPINDDVGEWLSLIEEAKKDARDYHKACERIKKKFRYENSMTVKRRKFQILWSNIEILKPAVYAKRPSPAVSNRWKDGDAVARIACELLERNLDFQYDVMDYDLAFKQLRDDFLLYARGVVRLRYEPIFKTGEVDPDDDGFSAAKPEDGEAFGTSVGGSTGPASDAGESQGDLDDQDTIHIENVALDHVNIADFTHPKARTWKELPWISFTSYMSRDALIKRFPDCGDEVQLDTIDDGEDNQKKAVKGSPMRKATIHEIWDKLKKRVVWVSPGYPDVLDECPPYLRFEGFFPCPRPAYGTLSTDSLEPRPDFIFYQDQAEEIDELTARIAALTDSLKLVGFYPAGPSGEGAPEIEMAVRPGFENRMIAVKSWAAFAQGGKSGAPIVWLPVEQVGEILKGCVELRKQLIDDVYQLTGISDIIRGTTEAEETAAAQGLKSQWGSLRLKERQNELARVARDVTRMAAEVVANHFQVATMAKCANMKIPTEAEQQQKIHQYQIAMRQFAMQQQMRAAAGSGMGGQPPPGSGMASASPGGPPPPGAPQLPPPQPAPPPGGVSMSGQLMPRPPAQGPSAGAPQSGGAPGGQLSAPPAPPQLGPTQEQIQALLRDGVTRRFLIDIETDSMIAADEEADKRLWNDFLEAVSRFIVAWVPLVEGQPILLPVASQLLLSAVRRYKVGRECEEVLEQAFDKLQAAAGQQKPPSGEQLKAQADLAKAHAEIQKAQIDAQASAADAKADIAMLQMKSQQMEQEHKLRIQQMQMDAHLDMQKAQMQLETERAKVGMQHQLEAAKAHNQLQAIDQQAQVASQQLQGQHQLEQSKQAGAQKTLAQQASMDEQKMVAKQAMDQFKDEAGLHAARQKHALHMQEKRPGDPGPEAMPNGKKRQFKIERGPDGRMAGINEL